MLDEPVHHSACILIYCVFSSFLESLKLDDHAKKTAKTLSGGTKRKVGIVKLANLVRFRNIIRN
jgi:ABC-type phosphate/phosphonate transport system ATPase subunit